MSNYLESSIEVFYKKGIFKNLEKLIGKHLCLCRSIIFIKLQASELQLYLKRDSDTGVSCKFSEVSKNTFFTGQKLILLTRVNLNKLDLT